MPRSQRHLRELQGYDSGDRYFYADAPSLNTPLADLNLTVSVAMTPVDVSGSFGGSPTGYSLVPLPTGLAISAAGVISGTPTVVAATEVQVVASTDNGAFVNSNTFTITVA